MAIGSNNVGIISVAQELGISEENISLVELSESRADLVSPHAISELYGMRCILVCISNWSFTASMLNGRCSLAGFGSQCSTVAVGGAGRFSSDACRLCTESYNGIDWSNEAPLSSSCCRSRHAGIGVQNAGLIFGGCDEGGSFICGGNSYNGSTWSNTSPLITSRSNLAGNGTQNAGLAFGGFTNCPLNSTEDYDGCSWSTGGNLIISRHGLAGIGTQCSGLAFGGGLFGADFCCSTEEYNGSLWQTGGNLLKTKYLLAGAGTQNAGLAFGGVTNVPGSTSNTARDECTEEYDGVTWKSLGTLNYPRYGLGGSGNQDAGLAFGGRGAYLGNEYYGCTELYGGVTIYSKLCFLTPISDSLIFYLDARNLDSYPRTGTTWYDLSGNYNHGLLENGPTFSTCQNGSISFAGDNDYVVLPNINLQQDFTLETLVYFNDISGALFGQGVRSGCMGLHIVSRTDGSGLRFGMYSNDLDYTQFNATSGDWKHLAFTYDHSTYEKKIYENGELVASNIGQEYIGSGLLRLGTTYSNVYSLDMEYLNGCMVYARGYSRVLSQTEIQRNYLIETLDSETTNPIITTGLRLHLDAGNLNSYPGTGTNWCDLSSNTDGVLNNGVVFDTSGSGSLSFDGTTGWVSVDNVYDFSISDEVTVETWAKSDNVSWNASGYLVSRRNQFIIHPDRNGCGRVRYYVDAGGYSNIIVYPDDITNWNHYVMTYKDGALNGYLNGTYITGKFTAGNSLRSDTGVVSIGRDDGFDDRYLDGNIAIVRIYDRRLSLEEIQCNYNAEKSRFGR